MDCSKTLKCPSCYVNYDHENRVPKVLNCGHTFCVVCLKQLCRNSEVCPGCKKQCSIPKAGVHCLPTNFLAISAPVKKPPESKNEKSVRNKTCQHGTIGSCKECQSSIIQQTAVRATNTALEDLQQALGDLNSVTTSKHHSQDIRKQMRDIRSHITSLCDSYSLAVDKLRNNLTDNADDIEKELLRNYKKWQKNSFLKQAEAQAFVQFSEAEIADAEDITLSREGFGNIERECAVFLQDIKSVTRSMPEVKQYNLRSTGIVSDILSSADIVSKPKKQSSLYHESDNSSSLNFIDDDLEITQTDFYSENDGTPDITQSSVSDFDDYPQFTDDQESETPLSLTYSDVVCDADQSQSSEPDAYFVDLMQSATSAVGTVSLDDILSLTPTEESNSPPQEKENARKHTSPYPYTALPQYSSAELLQEVGGRGLFMWPRGIACLVNDRIAIADQGHSRIHIMDPTLKKVEHSRRLGRSVGISDVAVDSKKRIFITEFANHRIEVVDDQCGRIYNFGSQGSKPGLYNNPTGIAIDQRDRVYICDRGNNRVQVVTTDGEYLSTLTKKGSGKGQLRTQPWFVSTDMQNNVVVADRSGYLYIFDETGNYVKTIARGQHNSFRRAGATVSDHQGNLLVADIDSGCIVALDKLGQVICKIGVKGKEAGEMSSPWGVTLNSKGNLFVCDLGNHKILQYKIPHKRVY